MEPTQPATTLPTHAEVGQRVSIRSHDPEGGFRDLLGHLVSVNQVRKKSGEIATFDPEKIALWKVVTEMERGTGIFLYDTMTRAQREVTISDGRELRLYCCGPTVYRDAHVGNLRTFLLGDLITRLLRLLDFKVRSVQNITDVGHLIEDISEDSSEDSSEDEDKILVQARRESMDPFALARSYETKFHHDLARLGIIAADIYPRASESIEMMQRLVQQLIDSENAYVGSDGSVYFSALSMEGYGALSGNKIEELIPGHKFEYTGGGAKRFHADWALWKNAGGRSEMIWDSPWGPGFPGWHIECSAMSLHYLHGHVDLHLGGIDLRFPHHENERAQSNSAIHNEVVDHWVHGEHLLFEGRKMSKSAGNVLLLEDLVERGLDPLSLRLVFLENKYRSQMDLTWSQIEAADITLQRWRRKYQEWSTSEVHNDSEVVAELLKSIVEILKSDLDTPRALIALRSIERDTSISGPTKGQLFAELDKIFGLDLTRPNEEITLTPEIFELLQLRGRAREVKDFALSDQLRDELLEQKIKVVDGPTGQTWEFIL
jgi:cysteinyl-tRNA synthetase